MYNHNYNVNEASDFFGQFDPSNLSPLFTHSLTYEYDYVHETDTAMLENATASSTTGSGCTGSSYIGSPSSPLSCTSSHPSHHTRTLFQRSISSQSLHKNGVHSSISNPLTSLSKLDLGSVRRVSSTGDLDQGVNMLRHHNHHVGSRLANETTSIIEGMTKPCRYSPEEKKEIIEKYRNKRSQRNFNKKIQYACRKTLADSRSRVRGRFARHGELEKSDYPPEIPWTQLAEDEEDWIHLLNSISSSIAP